MNKPTCPLSKLPSPEYAHADFSRRSHTGPQRFIGINVGAETAKVVELVRQDDGALRWTRRACADHEKQPEVCIRGILDRWNWSSVTSAAASGRLSGSVDLPQVPIKQAQSKGSRFLLGDEPLTLVSIGSHGFSVLELRADGNEIFRENSRCSQGTGNFLRQLVGRFSLTIEEASKLSAGVDQAVALSGRCPVILKTDMTHLANKGEDRVKILAGLFDAVCENVLTLIKPGICPAKVALIGGVSQSQRIQRTFDRRLNEIGLSLERLAIDDGLYFEALGCAVIAADQPHDPPPSSHLFRAPIQASFARVPSLSQSLHRVRRLDAKVSLGNSSGPLSPVIVGLDIGSTGSKAVAIDATNRQPIWEHYRATLGDPIGAAQALLAGLRGQNELSQRIVAAAVTGSGREIVGSLLTVCYGKESVYVLNEIAAHAEGARHFDNRVDTIFEIGGQDAKYIRLSEGRIIDCAMNEACSAGTGSFIEEQGRKFSGIRDVVHLSQEALGAHEGLSLGQHCSVFMAEVIDNAVAAGASSQSIIAGLYDSIIQNYLNRVKGSRTVGNVIFCQGMPFASDALAAAVARQTGSEVIVPPNPGTIGALGIALLAQKELSWASQSTIDLGHFARARIERKDTFRCKSTVGCGGAGNRCRIDRLTTEIEGQKLNFTWGGGCALYEKGTRKKKLPNLAPDPFREREAAVTATLAALTGPSSGKRIALTDEFVIKGHLPFFAAFFHHLGFRPLLTDAGDHSDLKRGVQGANVSFCAPMQLYHGVISRMMDGETDHLFLPMLCSLPSSSSEKHAVTCPIVQASADLVRNDLGSRNSTSILSPVIRFGSGGYRSEEFTRCCSELAASLGKDSEECETAFAKALEVQLQFESECRKIGARTLQYCRDNNVVPVVVLGRPYTLHNTVLNSNVPAILREQGAIGIPVDCFPIEKETPAFPDMYWSQGQRILRAAHQIRRTPGLYSVYCSNYSCGPDSFNLHFYSHTMQGKPFAVIETDGHSGDAGTKTRLEAFLHCVEQDLRSDRCIAASSLNDFGELQTENISLKDILTRRERLLIPWMGRGSEVLAASFRGLHIPAESLPPPDRAALALGRRHTSGKECLPAILTLGSLIGRLENSTSAERFAYLMSSTCGPCRFGVYNLLNQIVLKRLDRQRQVRIWSPCDTGYFDELPKGFAMLVFAGFMASDLLLKALFDTLPVENTPGEASAVYEKYLARLLTLQEEMADSTRSTRHSLWQIISGRLFGIEELLAEAAEEFRLLRSSKQVPTVLVVGEIYVRNVPFANDGVIERLQKLGVRAHLAPFHEWLDYCQHMSRRDLPRFALGRRISAHIQDRISAVTYETMRQRLNWPEKTPSGTLLENARPYLRDDLRGEAVLTLGSPLTEWKQGHIDGVLSVGPHECMPNKIAASQFFHITENHGLPSATLSLNGEPLDQESLESFVFEVKNRFLQKQTPRNRTPAVAGRHPSSVSPGAGRAKVSLAGIDHP